MKKIMLFITSLFLLLFTACQEEDLGNHTPALEKGESLISFSLPEPVTATRAALGETPEVEHLHVLVFNEKGFFLANAKATVVSQPDSGTGIGTFKVKLPVSNRPCRLHFVANADYDMEGKSWPTYVSTDTESTILGAMTTSENRAAYWGTVSVDHISDKGITLDKPVELIRNFAKVTLKQTALSGYEIESYTVYNCPTEGLLAPFNPYDGSFADFVSLTNDDPYGNFVKDHPDYRGTTKGEIAANELPAEAEWKTPDTPFYVYERNQDNSDIPTALVLKARNTTSNKYYYYKLDLIQFDNATYQTTTYNLFRNFAYDVTVNAIKADGYTDASDAVQAAASNNLAASVQVSKVKKITDGKHTLEVSTIDTLIVKTDPLVLKFKYMEGETDRTNTEDVQVHYEESSAFSNIAVDKSNGTITLTPQTPLPEVMQSQEITVATKSGLTRRIVVRVHEPYRFVSVDCQRLVAASQHQSFVLMTELPMGLPTAIFPLTLRIDMTDNTLYPDASMNRFPVDVVDAKNYVYQVEVDYNSYRQNRTMYSYFKTNTSQSATQISVEGTYFKESVPVSFTNGNPSSFTDVKFAGTNVTTDPNTKFIVPFGKGEAVKLEFNMTTTDKVTVYTRYLTDPTSTQGTLVEKKNSEGAVCGYEYQPKATGKQVIRFQTREYLAGGRIELFSENYVPVIINYTNPWVNVRFKIPAGVVPDNRIVKVYEDAFYQDFIGDLTPISGGNGQTVMRSFVGNQLETILYFLYQEGGRSYRGEMTVGELIEKGGGDGKLVTVELKQKYPKQNA